MLTKGLSASETYENAAEIREKIIGFDETVKRGKNVTSLVAGTFGAFIRRVTNHSNIGARRTC